MARQKHADLVIDDLSVLDIEALPDLYREYSQPDDDFIQSICTKGILEPVLVAKHGDKYIVIDGKLRVIAASLCRTRGIHVTVPIRILPIDISSKSGQIDAVIARFVANFNIFDRDVGVKERMMRSLPITKQLLIERINSDPAFARKALQGTVDEAFARLISTLFGVSSTTARRWIERLYKDADVNQAISSAVQRFGDKQEAALYELPTAQPQAVTNEQQAETSELTNALSNIQQYDLGVKIEEPPKRAEEAKPVVDYKPLTGPNYVFCGTNAVEQSVFGELLGFKELAPIMREMCNTGVLNQEMAVEILETARHDGIYKALMIISTHFATPNLIKLHGPVLLPELIRIMADQFKLAVSTMSYQVLWLATFVVLYAMANNKLDRLMDVLQHVHILASSKRYSEAAKVLVEFFSA